MSGKHDTHMTAPVDVLAPHVREVAAARKSVEHGKRNPLVPGAMERRERALAEAEARLAAATRLIEEAGEVVACFGEDEQWWESAYDTYMTGDNAGSDMLIRNSQDVRKLVLENFRAALARVGGAS